jgi:hypothetical protein
MSADGATVDDGPLALVCGGGSLPLAVADHVIAQGRTVLLFPVRGAAKPEDYAGRKHTWLHLGQFGTLARIDRVAAEYAGDALVQRIVEFIRTGKRPLTMAISRGEADEAT